MQQKRWRHVTATHGMTYDTSGQYTYQSQTIFGCDSIITLDLTIHPSYDIKETMAACDSITWQGTTYKQSGVYSLPLKQLQGVIASERWI